MRSQYFYMVIAFVKNWDIKKTNKQQKSNINTYSLLTLHSLVKEGENDVFYATF